MARARHWAHGRHRGRAEVTLPLTDTHCHVGAYGDPVDILRRAKAADVTVVAVTESPEDYRRLRMRLGARPGVSVALGMHPLLAHTFGAHDLARFFRLLPNAQWIGEIGLDFSGASGGSRRAQLRVFDAILAEAQPGRHPMTVHSRGAESEVVERLAGASVPAVLHWYTGPKTLVAEAVAEGLYFSVNPAMARTRGFGALITAVGRDRLLLETDGPYARAAGQPVRPDQLHGLVRQIAVIWGVDSATAVQVLEKNLLTLMSRVPKS